MPWIPPSYLWTATTRRRAQRELPRDGYDPSKQDQQNDYYRRTRTENIVRNLKVGLWTFVTLAILAAVGFIIFNLVTG